MPAARWIVFLFLLLNPASVLAEIKATSAQVACPVCATAVTVWTVNFARSGGVDRDFMASTHAMLVELTMCPHCHYVAYGDSFAQPVTPGLKRAIQSGKLALPPFTPISGRRED